MSISNASTAKRSTSKRIAASLALTALLAGGGIACSSSSSQASFCDTLKTQTKIFSASNFSDSDAMKKSAAALDKLKASAPAEIKDDVATLDDAANKLKDVNTSDTAAMLKVSKELDQKKLQAASTNVEKYAKDKCKIDLSS